MPPQLLSPRQLIDTYLLALAIFHGARLATLDRSLPLLAVRAASPERLVVIWLERSPIELGYEGVQPVGKSATRHR